MTDTNVAQPKRPLPGVIERGVMVAMGDLSVPLEQYNALRDWLIQQDAIRRQLVDALTFCRSVIAANAASVAEMSEDMALEKADAALKAAEATR